MRFFHSLSLANLLISLDSITSYQSYGKLSYRNIRPQGNRISASAVDISETEKDAAKVQTPMKKFFIETHGCQMNLADSDIVRSVLLGEGYALCDVLEDADLILTNTCAIRENAEAKVWQRLKYFQSLRSKRARSERAATGGFRKEKSSGYPIIGVLGCMAERLKDKLLEEEGVDFIAGPDAYRDLPKLLKAVTTDQKAANTQLSLEETYADIQPVRLAEGNTHAFVTITRGCDNHCAFCIVPYTRGRERSRPVDSIIAEVGMLKSQGFKEVVLLGQNVNSYHYTGDEEGLKDEESSGESLTKEGQTQAKEEGVSHQLADGFRQPGRKRDHLQGKVEKGKVSVRFAELLRRVSAVDPEMRVRFQSPHPKDFSDEVLRVVRETPNVCCSLHMPAQHGSSAVLERMRRGYGREAYLSLVQRARSIIGGQAGEAGLGLSSDFISGFCGETEEEHLENLTLLREVGFDQAFTYSYSRREQTYAGLFLQDDVPAEVKSRRLTEMVDTFQEAALERNSRLEVGRLHLVLVEGPGKSSSRDNNSDSDSNSSYSTWTGRTDTNKRVVFSAVPASILPQGSLTIDRAKAFAVLRAPSSADSNSNEDRDIISSTPTSLTAPPAVHSYPEEKKGVRQKLIAAAAVDALQSVVSRAIDQIAEEETGANSGLGYLGTVEKGSYVVCKIASCRGHTMRAVPIALSTLQEAHKLDLPVLSNLSS